MESRLGRYLVLKHLTSGGMADVLLGRSDGIEGFERHVVLKRIRPEHARDQRFIRMFLDEARVAASLHHQHIVQVHDIGEADGDYFIAMEYIHGEDVRAILSKASKTRAHVPLPYAIAIVAAAAAGLHYAHERRGHDKRPLGIVHRDISPSNILVGYDGAIKVVDFGIAKASMRPETRWSSLKGKVSYMSPEQCKGGEVDRRSDVYSLGVVLYELATTTRLFKGESDYLVMDQIVNGRVTLPQVRRPDLPNELAAIIMRAITPDPERRYFTADELRVALDRFAGKAGLNASTSAIGTYLRKQFGERPEPWLELEDQTGDGFDDVQVSVNDTAQGNSWTELPRSDEQFRRSTSSIPRLSGPIAALAGNAISDTGSADSNQGMPVPRLPTAPEMPVPSAGWQRKHGGLLANLTPAKIAMISAPLFLLLGIAIWQLAGSSTPEPVIATVTTPPPPPPPVVTPVPEPTPPPAAAAVAVDTAATQAATVRAAAEPASARNARDAKDVRDAKAARPAAPAPGKKPATTLKMDPPPTAAPATAKVEMPAASAVLPSVSAPVQQPVAAATPAVAAPAPSIALPPPPPAPTPPQVVTPTALDANRIAGDKDIIPDNTTQGEIGRAGVEKIMASYKLCISADGNINNVTQLKSTGFPAYDAKIQNTIRSQWRYRPFMVNGKPVAVCTAVRFIYSQK